MLFRPFIPLLALALTGCSPGFFGEDEVLPSDTNVVTTEVGGVQVPVSSKLVRTFGQLEATGGVSNHAAIRYTPAAYAFTAPADGTIRYFATLGTLGDCLIFAPKQKTTASGADKYAGLHPDFAKSTDIRMAFCNFENSGGELKTAMGEIFKKRGVSETEEAAPGFTKLQQAMDGFMAGTAGFEVLDVFARESDGSGPTKLGALVGGELRLATYVPDDPATDAAGPLPPLVEARTYYNPLEYLKPFVPASVFQAQAPEIADLFLEVAPAAGMAGAVSHDFDLVAGTAQPPASVEHMLRATVELEVRADAAADGPTVAPFSIAYQLDRLTLDAAGLVTGRNTASRGRAALSHMRPDDPTPVAAALYDVAGSSVAANRYRLRLPIDATRPPFAGDPDWARATDPSLATELDSDAMSGANRVFPFGEYELKITVADVWGSPIGDAIRTVRFVLEPAVMFVRDRADDNVIDHTDPPIDHAQPGHWGDDKFFGALAGVDGYTAANAVINGLGGTFIDNDHERFYLRARDHAANADPAARDTVTAQIGTLAADGTTIDDDLTALTLRETGNNTGIFVSAAQLLTGEDVPVADNPDDDFAVHDGISAALNAVADDAAGDRTHRVKVDGHVRAEFTPGGGAMVRNEIDVCDRGPEERKVLNVRLFNFREPFNDTGFDPDGAGPLPVTGAGNGSFDFADANGNGRHDSGERSEAFIDISNGAAVFARGNAGAGSQRGTIWTDAQIDRQLLFSRSYLASACIRLTELSRTAIDPTGTLFLTTMGQFDDFPDDDGVTGTPTRDEAVIAANFRSTATPLSDTALDVYFVAPFTVAAAGEAFPPLTLQPAPAGMGLSNSFVHHIVVGLNAVTLNLPMALAHEFGHQLGNQVDANTATHIMFPSAGVTNGAGTTHSVARRFQSSMETNFRAARGASLSAAGNSFLQNP